ncbi:MAG: FecR domain-containing protein [Halomonas sp.]|nr:FecR domain-containing protein [Halomonas sp.]
MARFTKHPIARWVSIHASVGSLIIPMAVWANNPAGEIMFIHGDASIERDGERTAAERGDDIFAGDTFHTESASTLQIRYSDGGTKAIQPESTYTLESYNEDPDNPEDSEQSGELVRGGLRAVTGLIGRNAPENVSHKTPVATMGIRGTSFQLVHVPEGETPPIPGMATGSYLYVESGMLSMSTDAGERIVRPGQVVFSAAADATPEFLADGLAIFEQLEEQRREQTRQDGETSSNDSVGSTTLDANTDSRDATTGTFFDNIALAPTADEQVQRDQTDTTVSQQVASTNTTVDNIENQIDAESEPSIWIDFAPDNSLTTANGGDYLNGFYEEKTTPTEQGNQNLEGGEVVWGYWDASTPKPNDSTPLGISTPFIAASDEFDDTLSFDLSEQALSAIRDQLTAGVTFNWADGTGLVNQAGDDVIPILDSSSITLASNGSENTIAVDIQLEGLGRLENDPENQTVAENFPINSISLTHENCEPDCFDTNSTFLQGQYIGEDAAAIMSLIEASGEGLGSYSGTGLFER